MSEVLLNESETRPTRSAADGKSRSKLLRPMVIGSVCAAGLAGLAVAASSVMAGLVSPPMLHQEPAIGQGLATSWPDLKDGLPAKAGIVVKTVDSASAAPSVPAPTRIGAIQEPMSFTSSTPAPAPKPVASAQKPVSPTERIPVPTVVAVLPSQPAARAIAPPRAVATIVPSASETVRARDETKPAETPAPVAAVSEKAPTVTPTSKPAKAIATAKPPAAEPAKIATAKPAVAKPVASKPDAVKTAGAKPAVTQTAAAETDSDETEILGVKLPSLAPAGRKLQDGVSALGDAVRNAF